MKNRKGTTLLPEEVLKIVVAVICIGFLIFLLVSIYLSATGNQKQKQAEEIMNSANGLKAEIERVNAGGEVNSQGFLVPNPSGWYIFSFTEQEVKPNSCAGDNCICICENVGKCDEKGSCAVVSNLNEFENIKIEKGGIALLIRKVNEQIEISRK